MIPKPEYPFLAEWLSGKLSDENLRGLVGDTEFLAYKKLRDALDSLEPEIEDHTSSYNRIKEKASRPVNPKVINMSRLLAIAAVLVVLFGIAGIFSFSAEISAGGRGQLAETLPDGSKVNLNRASAICHPAFFAVNRRLKLEGEAYFQVEKGSTFKVITPQANVRVLGTKFSVVSKDGIFAATCYEGKVAVDFGNKTIVLLPTQGLRIENGVAKKYNESSTAPAWIIGDSRFSGVPLAAAIREIERLYDVSVSYPASLAAIRFSGSITHKNLETALKSVCIPNGLQFEVNEKAVVISR